ncbi:MAG: DUF6077 domain-containing protein [Halioglobus sp.]
MLAQRLNQTVEKSVLLLICFWGNWGLYYLVAVLLLDASLADLQRYLPVLGVQVLASVALLWRLTFAPQTPVEARRAFERRSLPALSRRVLTLAALAAVTGFVIVFAVARYSLTHTALSYNLLWVLLLPVCVLYAVGYPARFTRNAETGPGVVRGDGLLDVVLLIACILFLAVSLYGTGFHTYDDAYYGFIFSSLLADPAAPVLAADPLFGSDAPYVLHPAYRTVGYEVLLALAGSLTGADPLALYHEVMPAVNAATWLLATYVLLRVLHAPYPGVALAAVLLVMLFWTDGFSLGSSLRFMFWGKSLLFFAAAPLLFVAVARLCDNGGIPGWWLLLLIVAAAQTWSSTGLFLAPFAAGLAVLVFAPLDSRFWRVAALAFAALVPVLLAMACSLLVLAGTEIADNGLNAGIMRVQGHAFGTLPAQVAVLVVVCVVPLVAKYCANGEFDRRVTRFALVAFFTVMTPFLLEWIALTVGSNFLARRLVYAFPLAVMVGILVSIGVELILTGRLLRGGRSPRLAFVSLVLGLGLLAVAIDRQYLFGDWWRDTQVFRQDFEEARKARALIPEGAFVAAGDIDDILPVFASPPRFVAVRHYLDYHRSALAPDDYWARKRIFSMLTEKKPLENDTIGSSTARLLHMAERLGVTTIVFQEVWGKRRPPANIETAAAAPDEDQKRFLHQLKKRLGEGGYTCEVTSSRRTWVCNR